MEDKNANRQSRPERSGLNIIKLIKEYPHKHALFITALLCVLGILLMAQSATGARQALYDEHDRHLLELASSVDHNVSTVLSRCRTELAEQLKSETVQEEEALVLNGGGKTGLRRDLQSNSLFLSGYASRILVGNGEKILFSTDEKDPLCYRMLPDDDGDDVRFCVDESTDTSYLAVSCSSAETRLEYTVLLDFETFYRKTVVDEIYSSHWILLYDRGSGLTVQNENQQPGYTIMTEEEMLSRSDGYAMIARVEKNGVTESGGYRFTDAGNGREYGSRMTVVPTQEAENGVFTVAVAVYDTEVEEPINLMSTKMMLAAMMIAFGIAAAGFLVLHTGKREKELAGELEAMEKEQELNRELQKQREELDHHQKLETIGTLTAGIAHEFNNLLTPIMGDSMLIMEKSRTADEEVFENALEIYEASDRARDLVSRISKLSRKQSVTQMKVMAPSSIIRGVLSMTSSTIPGNITVVHEFNTPEVLLGDENQLNHMLLNLVINAVQAMKPNEGTLTVSAFSDEKFIYITVSDTGKGIPQENLETIFDPFFTTKESGKGTGLGLSIAQRTANNHGGKITAENLPQGGARFTVQLPVFKKPY